MKEPLSCLSFRWRTAWGGAQRSLDRSTDGVADGWEHITLDGLNLDLLPGECYAAFVSTIGRVLGTDYTAKMGYISHGWGVYGDGQFFYSLPNVVGPFDPHQRRLGHDRCR